MRNFGALAIALILASCSEAATSSKDKAEPPTIFPDYTVKPIADAADIEGRARKAIIPRNGFVIVRDTIDTQKVFSANYPWAISCTIIGLSVTFDPAGGDINLSTDVPVATGEKDASRCDVDSVTLADSVARIMREASNQRAAAD